MLQKPKQGQSSQGMHTIASVDGLSGSPHPPESVAVGPHRNAALDVVMNLGEVVNQLHRGRPRNGSLDVATHSIAGQKAERAQAMLFG